MKKNFIMALIPFMITARQQLLQLQPLHQELQENLSQKSVGQLNEWLETARIKLSQICPSDDPEGALLLEQMHQRYFKSPGIKELLQGSLNYMDIIPSGRGLAPQKQSALMRSIDQLCSIYRRKTPSTPIQLLSDANLVFAEINLFEKLSGNHTQAAIKRNEIACALSSKIKQLSSESSSHSKPTLTVEKHEKFVIKQAIEEEPDYLSDCHMNHKKSRRFPHTTNNYYKEDIQNLENILVELSKNDSAKEACNLNKHMQHSHLEAIREFPNYMTKLNNTLCPLKLVNPEALTLPIAQAYTKTIDEQVTLIAENLREIFTCQVRRAQSVEGPEKPHNQDLKRIAVMYRSFKDMLQLIEPLDRAKYAEQSAYLDKEYKKLDV